MTDRPAWLPPHGQRLLPYIVVEDAAAAMAFAETAFGAETVGVLRHDDGAVWNGEMALGENRFMFAEARGFGPYPAFLYVYVEDCDATIAKAVEAGAEALQPAEDQFYGDRNGGVRDPFGNLWWIASSREALPQDELERRAADAAAAKAQSTT